MLRVTCDGGDIGAEVYVNDKFKGECPIDLQVPAGSLKLLVRKTVDAQLEQVFEQAIRMGDGVVKKVEAVLPAPRLNAAAQKRENQRLAVERAANVERRAEFDAALASGALQAAFRDCPDCPEMVAIPPGSFEMGSNNGDADGKLVHRVSIDQAFALGKTEVTQGQWKAIMGNNPSKFSDCGDTCPVERVSWNDIQEFLQKLNSKTGKQYRLPTEAEWEYACYGGSQSEYCGGGNLDAVGWYDKNSGNVTHPVGQKQTNGYGLYDMSGNVWEWMQDEKNSRRALRGGSWFSDAYVARAANRIYYVPGKRIDDVGFRVARTLP